MDEYNQAGVPDRWNPSHFFGLIYPDKTLKPGARAFMLTASLLRGAEYRPELPLREGIAKVPGILFFRRDDGLNILFIWNEGRRRNPLRLSAGAELTSYDILTGEGRPLGTEALLEPAREPLVITWTGGETPRLENP